VREFQVDTGASLGPQAAYLVLRGISTLALRMERHSASAAALGAWLERQEGVSRVFHPSLASHPQRAVAARQLAAGGGMLAFELEGGRAAGEAFIDALRIPQLTASLGSVFTMVVHPPSTTHRQLDDAALRASGITPGLLRCSVGLEDVDDLIADFEGGLAAARDAARTASATAAPA
jgi:cystathionine beta-lyase/cystathionine gamma-synthase